MNKLILAGAFTSLTMIGCKITKVVKMMNSESVTNLHWTNGSKDVIFIPMIHVGKAEFYVNVMMQIDSFKRNGYTVYYEGVRKYLGADSAEQRTNRIKLRKIIGFELDSTGYSSVIESTGLLKGKIAQPNWKTMGIDTSVDRNTDITYQQLIGEYERRHGEIKTVQLDEQVKLKPGESYPSWLLVPREQAWSVITGYRDQVLASHIDTSSNQKILVVFGLAHAEGTFAALKANNSGWRKQ